MKTFLSFIAVGIIFFLIGCSGSISSDNPEAAYRAFIKALIDKNFAELYNLLDTKTHAVLTKTVDTLIRLDSLPQAPRNLPGGEDRAVLTKAARSDEPAKELLLAYFIAHPFSYNEEQKRGSELEKVDLKGNVAIITTRGGEDVTLIKEESWKVMELYTIFSNFNNEIDAALAKAAVPPKPANTPQEAFLALVAALKDGNYDLVYFMLDANTRHELDEIAQINQKLVRKLEENPNDKKLADFLGTVKFLKATRNGREVLVAVMGRFTKPSSVELAGAVLPEVPTETLNAVPAPTSAVLTKEVVLETATGEKVRFIKETSEGKEGWHTDFLLETIKKIADEFQQLASKEA